MLNKRHFFNTTGYTQSNKDVCFFTFQNVQPDPPKEVTELQDELVLTNVEWAQSFKELQTKIEKLEQTIKDLKHTIEDQQQTIEDLKHTIEDLKQAHGRDINFITSALLNDTVKQVEETLVGYKRPNENDNFGEGKEKKSRNA